MKILEILHSGEKSTDDASLKILTEKFDFLNQVQVEVSLEENVQDLIQKMNEGQYSSCKVHPTSFQKTLKRFARRTQQVQDVGCFDYVEKKDKELWPDLILWKEFTQVLVSQVKQMDFSAVAYIVGANPVATCVLTGLVHLGFQKIRWIIHDDDFIPEEIDRIQKTYFGLQLEILSSSKLSLRSVDGAILVNTTTFENRPEMLQDISYFNFIRQDSFVVDLDLCRSFSKRFASPLIEEASSMGLQFLPAPLFMYEIDRAILEKQIPLTADQVKQVRDFYLQESGFMWPLLKT